MTVKGVKLAKGMSITFSRGDVPAVRHTIERLRPFRVIASQQGKRWMAKWTPSEYAEEVLLRKYC